MYYILNQDGQIAAADPQLLSQLNIDNVDELYRKISREELSVTLEEEKVTFAAEEESHTYSVTKSPLTGTLGDLTLVVIDPDSKTTATVIPKEEAISPTDEQKISDSDDLHTFGNDPLFDLKDENAEAAPYDDELPIVSTSGEIDMGEIDIDDELFDLIIPATDAENTIVNIEEDTDHIPSTTAEEETTPIYIDIDTISQKIGISPDDYKLFLDEYINTALMLEATLQSDKKDEQAEALHTLSHLSNVLHLPYVNELLEQIEHAPEDKRDDHIRSFFTTLGRLTTADFEEEKPLSETEAEYHTKAPGSEEETSLKTTDRTPIDLSDVKPIHFDFQLEAAAKDLSLPVELIEEFVNDFIDQAHEETTKILSAYEKGDLETVQKIGHLLKGTSSNLRINPLSDTLYEIQFNEDIDKVPELVRNYWGHFLSFENQIKLISHK